MIVAADTSGLLAAVDAGDTHHQRVVQVLHSARIQLVITPIILAELDFMVRTRVGVRASMDVLGTVESGAIELCSWGREQLAACRELLSRYADLRLGLADASVAVLAAEIGADAILTLDERDFRPLRAPSGASLPLFPADA